LVPAIVFAFLLGVLEPRHRVLSWLLFALSAVGLIGTYMRSALLAVPVALLVSLALLYRRGARPLRSHRVAALGALVILAFAVAGVAFAFARSSALERRATNIVHPQRDLSYQIRVRTWKYSLRRIRDDPLGEGLGTIHALALKQPQTHSTHNSFLTVGREQGILGGALFLFGVVCLVVSMGRGVRRRGSPSWTLAAPAFGAVLATMLFSLTFDNLEQPGKVLTWGLLGLGMAACWGAGAARAAGDERAAQRPGLLGVRVGLERVPAAALCASLIVLLVAAAMLVSAPRARAFETERAITIKRHGKTRVAARWFRGIDRYFPRSPYGRSTSAVNPALTNSRVLDHVSIVRHARPPRLVFSAAGPTPALSQYSANLAPGALLLVGGRLYAFEHYGLAFGRQAPLPVVREGVDRLANRLPGPFPPRPNLLWGALAAALVGLVLAASLALAAFSRGEPAVRGRV
jgi:O-antigen ligase/polysaccharide polymerase Wzy-like membrane protein